MRIDILTLFPHMFDAVLNESILKRAREAGYLDINVHDIREAAPDKHHTVDDTPYGGGTGMVMRVDVIDRAIQNVIKNVEDTTQNELPRFKNLKLKIKNSLEISQPPNKTSGNRKDNLATPHIILLTPQGKRLNNSSVELFAQKPWIILICGHYEGFDERIRKHLVDEQVSIGDYVLTGGELPALVLVDAVSRFVPGVLPEGAPQEDSFSLTKDGKPALEYPHYTKPQHYKGWTVPEVLLSGNHAEINKWRQEQSRPT